MDASVSIIYKVRGTSKAPGVQCVCRSYLSGFWTSVCPPPMTRPCGIWRSPCPSGSLSGSVARRADHVPVVAQRSALLWPCGNWRCCAVGGSCAMCALELHISSPLPSLLRRRLDTVMRRDLIASGRRVGGPATFSRLVCRWTAPDGYVMCGEGMHRWMETQTEGVPRIKHLAKHLARPVCQYPQLYLMRNPRAHTHRAAARPPPPVIAAVTYFCHLADKLKWQKQKKNLCKEAGSETAFTFCN